MQDKLLHIYRNTPYGRETFLNSIYFCQQLNLELHVYIPREKQFLMYFANNTINVDVDRSYTRYNDTARANAEKILENSGLSVVFVSPAEYTASNLPDIPTTFDYMACPRIISDLSTKIGLGKIGSKVRDILYNAPFPVLLPAQVFKPWGSLAVMFGGSPQDVKALYLGEAIARGTGLPLDIFTQARAGSKRADYEKTLTEKAADLDLEPVLRRWWFFDQGDFTGNLFCLDHDALVIMGVFGQGKIRKFLLGSTAELVQATLPNNLLLVGSHYERQYWRYP